MQYFILFLPIICTYRERIALYLPKTNYILSHYEKEFLTIKNLIVMINIIVNFIKQGWDSMIKKKTVYSISPSC